MASLTHPNVVPIYDVCEVEGDIYLAMALVDGSTLRTWLQLEPRGWREIIAVFIEAGRGLAAAHANGLVHRDFKPDNVLIDSQGTARVTDFGLVTTIGEPTRTGGPHDGTVTVERSYLVGTPCYMAPEQSRGLSVDFRADQFSFCVALYEALWEKYPFAPRENTSEIRRPPRSADVPGVIWKILQRGLGPTPESRWPSMNELLEQLEACVAPARNATVPSAASLQTMWRIKLGAILLGILVLSADEPVLLTECRIHVEPEILAYTPPFDNETRCTCSAAMPRCHELFQGRVLSIHDLRADLEFKKVNSGRPSTKVHYWVLGGAQRPICTRLDEYRELADGYWTVFDETLRVDNVSIWPTQAEFDAAMPGDARTVFLATGDGAGDIEGKTWYQPSAIVFTKICD